MLCSGFVYGDLGSNACPAGSTRITELAACQSAAAAQGKAWGRNDSWSAHPAGCLLNGDAVYFNTIAPGSGSSASRPLCAIAGVP
jgi:hypothetical protein